VAVVGTAVLFGALEAGSGAMQREAGIPAVWVIAVEALVILAVLATDQVWRRHLSRARRKPTGDSDGDPASQPEPARA